MYMTNSEICTSYREAGKTPTQIEILADLNACPMEDIVTILADGGYAIPNKFAYMMEDETLYICGKPYKRPLTMSRYEWYQYKQKVRAILTEQEHLINKIWKLKHKLDNEIDFIKAETWRGEYE